MITKNVGCYDFCHPTAKECMICITLPPDAPSTNLSAIWADGEEPDIDDMPPSEVTELISLRIEGYLLSTSREENRKIIDWIRDKADWLDAMWAREEIERLIRQTAKLTDRITALRQDFLYDE